MESKEQGKQAEHRKRVLEVTFREIGITPEVEEYASLRVSEAVEAHHKKLMEDEDTDNKLLKSKLEAKDKEIAELNKDLEFQAQAAHKNADEILSLQAQLEQAKKEKHDLRKIFDSGRFWAETYSGWFIPDKSDHDKKFNESVSGYVSVSTEKEELNKEIADFLHWINENTDLKNHDRDIESYTNRLLNIFINLKD